MSHIQNHYDELAERSLIGCLLTDPDAMDRIASSRVNKKDFYYSKYSILFEAIESVYLERKPIDYVTVHAKLYDANSLSILGDGDNHQGIQFLVSVHEECATSAHVEYYAKRVKGEALKREMIKTSKEILSLGETHQGDYDELKQKADSIYFKLNETCNVKKSLAIRSILKGCKETFGNDKRKDLGLKTGFHGIDERVSGLMPGQLIIIAARPGIGKTALALNIVINTLNIKIAKKETLPSVAFFSLEMLDQELGFRFISSVTNFDLKKEIDDRAKERLLKQIEHVEDYPVFINDNGYSTLIDIQAECRRIKSESGLGLVVIDYIQLINSHTKAQYREQQVAEISRGLKQLAKELQCPIIALSQLNRTVESRQDKKPTIADLRESGAIEQDADIIFLIHRDETDANSKNKAEIIIGKNRSGETGTVSLKWSGQTTSFSNIY